MNGTINVSAVVANGVGVYWDSNRSNADRVFSIDWGTLTPGSVKSVVVYIRNEVEEPIFFIISTMNWTPGEASKYITLRWDYTGRRIDSYVVLQIELRLFVSRDIEGISNFYFDVLVTGSENLLGDLNGDGVVDIVDLIIVTIAFGSKPGDLQWKTMADSNGD
jgi:hypothetical protein